MILGKGSLGVSDLKNKAFCAFDRDAECWIYTALQNWCEKGIEEYSFTSISRFCSTVLGVRACCEDTTLRQYRLALLKARIALFSNQRSFLTIVQLHRPSLRDSEPQKVNDVFVLRNTVNTKERRRFWFLERFMYFKHSNFGLYNFYSMPNIFIEHNAAAYCVSFNMFLLFISSKTWLTSRNAFSTYVCPGKKL